MKMLLTKYLVYGLLAIAVAMTTACGTVVSKREVGETVATVSKTSFEGIWRVDFASRDYDGDTSRPKSGVFGKMAVVASRVKNTERGVVELLSVEVKDDKFDVQPTWDVIFRMTSAGMIGSVKNLDKKGVAGYEFFRTIFSSNGEYLLVYAPDTDLFKRLIEQGDIKGVVDNGSVVIDGLTETDFDRLLEKGIRPNQLFRSEPLILHRIVSR